MAIDAMVKFIGANATQGTKGAGELKKMTFEDLKVRFREVAAGCIKDDKAVHELLREQLPAYAAATAK